MLGQVAGRPLPRLVAVHGLRSALLPALVCVVLAAGCGGDEDASSGDDPNTADKSNVARELFAAKGCAECHGPEGEGSETVATSLVGTRMIIQQFQTRVRNGRGTAMPAHTPEQISDEEIRLLYDWLRAAE